MFPLISEKELNEAIAECQGVRNPNAATCLKLAAFYTIQDHMSATQTGYSYAAPEQADQVSYDSGTEFSDAIYGKNSNDMWAIMDELMTVLQATNKRLYNGVLAKIE